MNTTVDTRCWGSGACMINAEGECWCGQKWNGKKMSQTYYVNEAGLRVDATSGELAKAPVTNSQCLTP